MKNRQKNFFLSGSDGGSLFSTAIIVSFLVSIIFALITQSLSMGEGLKTYLGYFTTSLALALVLFYALFFKGVDFKQGIAFKKFQKKYIIIALLLSIGALFALSWINEGFIALMKNLFGYEGKPIELPKNGVGDFLLCTLFICIMPAFFEECLFRGLLLNGCKRLGDLFAILTSAILFSIFHTNPMQTVYQFIMGAIFSLLVIKSGSIIPAILMHFVNNFYIIVYYFLTPANYVLPNYVNAILTVIGACCLVLGLFWLIKCEKPLIDQQLTADYQKIVEVKDERKSFLIFSLIGVLCCLVLWISNLLSYVG